MYLIDRLVETTSTNSDDTNVAIATVSDFLQKEATANQDFRYVLQKTTGDSSMVSNGAGSCT